MKKNWFYILLSVAIATIPLTSCDDDDAQPTPENQPELRIPVTSHDALSWLQGCLVVVDENGELFRRVYGEALDESQPTVISVPVQGYEAAEQLFLSWVAPGKEATRVDGGYDYVLTNANGNEQGSVSFRAVEGEAGVVARMSVASGTDLKQISEVKFIDYNFWPENAAYEKVEAGKIYYIEDYVLKWTPGTFSNTFNKPEKKSTLPFYCIQGNTDGKEGILVWLSPDSSDSEVIYHPRTSYYADNEVFKYLATPEEIDKVRKVYDNNQTLWNNMLKEMDAKQLEWGPKAYACNTSEFVYQSKIAFDDGILEGIGCLLLNKPKSVIVYATIGRLPWFSYFRYMHVETIPPFVE